MGRLIFDIETVGADFDTLDAAAQEYLLRWTGSEEEEAKVRDSLSLYPLTGEIVAIGMLNPDANRGAVYFQAPGKPQPPREEGSMRFESGTEKDILKRFWEVIKPYEQFITFNGRSFDCPFIIIRSAVHGVKATRDLMPNRYQATHLDLFDLLSFYGATRRKFSLDMWCRTFGIKSPKEDGITGCQVKELFQAGQHLDIARYCAGDLQATKELLRVWEHYIKFPSASAT